MNLCSVNNEMCKRAGNKRYNYGFMSGTAGWCFHYGKWQSDIETCPEQNAGKIKDP